VLLIAVARISRGLLLVRAMAGRQGIMIQAALGAGRGRPKS